MQYYLQLTSLPVPRASAKDSPVMMIHIDSHTDLFDSYFGETMSPEALAKNLAIPLGGFGDPEQIVSMVVFLVGPDSIFITGQYLGVKGGSVMQ